MLAVALDLLFLRSGVTGGMETYARNLVPRLRDVLKEARVIACVDRDLAAEISRGEWGEGIEPIVMPMRAGSPVMRTAAQVGLLGAFPHLRHVDLVHGLGNSIPPRLGRRRVVTIHDCIPFSNPESTTAVLGLGARLVMRTSARQADRVLVVSEATKRDVTALLGVAADRVDVVHSGCGVPTADATPQSDLREKYGLGTGPVVLVVAGGRAHKNVRRVVDAMADVEHAQLVVVGRVRAEELSPGAGAAGSCRLRCPGWVSAEDLEGLYRLAACVVVPSLVEGFGLPLLEAMVRGTPVAASDIPVFREIGGDAVAYFDPTSPDSIASAVRGYIADRTLAKAHVQRGFAVCERFSWDEAAARTVESYRRALDGP
jgi:glycosyltransferase involved in cell wall biosynthesis